MNPPLMAAAARTEAMQKIIQLVDFPVEIVGDESIKWETDLSWRFAEAQRLYSEFTATFKEPLLRYFPILQTSFSATGVPRSTDAPSPPPKEETDVVEKENLGQIGRCNRSSDQNQTDESMHPLPRAGFMTKRRRTRMLSEIYQDCDDADKLPLANRACKSTSSSSPAEADAIEIKNESENSLNNINKSTIQGRRMRKGNLNNRIIKKSPLKKKRSRRPYYGRLVASDSSKK